MSEQQPIRYKINICLIATRKYFIFVQPLIDSICKYFLLNHDIEINLFVDDLSYQYFGDKRVSIKKVLISSYKFPQVSLYRYDIMTSVEFDCDYWYYLDVDYLIVSEISEEILGDIVGVLHPGFSCVGGGSWCDDPNSNAFTSRSKMKHYFCGGTQGGSYEYYKAMIQMALDIREDESRLVKPEHNDESYWNKYLSELEHPFKILDSSYCLVEQMHLRKLWKIDHLEPKIIALKKNHSEIRN